jgi:iron-sulfur cluster assembly accessory protein
MADDAEDKSRKYKIGDERLCKITEKAASKFNRLLLSQNLSNGALRIAVIGGGISGLNYKIESTNGPNSKDVLVVTKNVKLVIDFKSARFISGSVVDLHPETGDFEVKPQ